MQPLFDPANPNILIFDKLDSTSAEAKKMIRSDFAEHGLIIWAKEQSNAHGRYGRNWQSPLGNLSFSLVLENDKDFSQIAIYPFIAALSIKDALEQYVGNNKVSFKWPNDIFLNGKKIAGILFESEIIDHQVKNMICGIGMNIIASPSELPYSSSLSEEGIEGVSCDELLFPIVMNFDKYLKLSQTERGVKEIYQNWLDAAHNLGEKIIVISAGKEIRGIFSDIRDGNLVIKQGNEELLIYTGDVFFSEDEKMITTVASNIKLNNVTFLNNARKSR